MSDGDETDDGVVERLAPEEAFELLGHETRFRVLEVLNGAGALSFSDLRDRVGMRDPGQFNYHLGKLTGRFVRKTDDGYRLAAAGRRVVGAVLSGSYTQTLEAETIPVEGSCLVCDGGLEATFREEGIRITCRECGFDHTNPDIPPSIVDSWPKAEVPAAVDRWLRRNEASAGYGFCPNCDGHVTETVALPGESAAPDWFTGELAEAVVVYDCDRCGDWWHATVPLAVLTHPAVVGLHYDHGIDLRETPTWELDWLNHGLASVTSEDPLRVEIPIELDGGTHTFTFDRDLAVVDDGDT